MGPYLAVRSVQVLAIINQSQITCNLWLTFRWKGQANEMEDEIMQVTCVLRNKSPAQVKLLFLPIVNSPRCHTYILILQAASDAGF